MSKSLQTVSLPRPAAQERSLASNLASYAASGLLFSGFLTGALAVSALLSLARLV